MVKSSKTKRPPFPLSDRRIEQMAVAHGALAAKMISPVAVRTGQWVRWKCQFGCDGFGSSLVCPPHTPTPEQTRKMLDEYRRAVLFESPLRQAKKIAAALERELFLAGYYKALGLGAGPCRLCPTCDFEKGCRHAELARPAMEAVGIDVYATARGAGFVINVVRGRSDPQHYFGLVLIE
jgi:predicted metal-binding protein